MHPTGSSSSSSPFGLSPLPFLLTLNTQLSDRGFEFDSSSWLFQQHSSSSSSSSMDFPKLLTSVLSTRFSSHRPEVPARAAAAAAVARALATLTPDQRLSLPSSSAELSSIYGSQTQCPVVEELEDCFYEEDFDPVLYILENIPSDEDELEFFENKATVRLAQLERISERLSQHVMQHHEEMVKGMQLVRELEKDLKIATVICMNGRRHLTSSMNEVSRDLIVTTNSRKKQALLDLLPVLTELRYAQNAQKELDSLVGEGNFCKAFQVLSEYLQLLDTHSDLSAVQEMSRSVEGWLENTLQKLDSLLLEVCQVFKEETYITVVDAYALIGDVSGLAEKIQSYFMQEVLSETHCALKTALQEDQDEYSLQISSKLTYSDLCFQIPESKFRQCLLTTLAVLFRLMCSYYAIMSFHPENKVSVSLKQDNTDKQCVPQREEQGGQMNGSETATVRLNSLSSGGEGDTKTSTAFDSTFMDSEDVSDRSLDASVASSSGSPWYELRRDATAIVSQSLQRGRRNLWQLTVSRVSVLLSSSAFSSTSIHQFLKNYEDLNVFALAGEAFCGTEAIEFRNKLMSACQNYFINFHKHNIHALKIVLERECWQQLPHDAIEAVSFAGLVGDGAPLFAPDVSSMNGQLPYSAGLGSRKNGFSLWLSGGNPFLPKDSSPTYHHIQSDGDSQNGKSLSSSNKNIVNHINGNTSILEDENEDLLADFIDEDSQLPSRISKPSLPRNRSSQWRDDEATTQTGSSLCLLRFMDKYARLMQKLGMINVELFKGLCQLFELYYYFVYETFSHQDSHANNKGVNESLNYRLKTAINRITQDCEQWLKPGAFTSSSSTSLNTSNKHVEPTPTVPPGCSFGLKERSTAVDTVSLVARILLRSKPHLQSMLLQNNPAVVEDFYVNLVDSVPDLIVYIHRTTAKSLLHINGYSDRIANAKWEVKELGMEHNGYVDLLLGEFKHYKTRLAHAGIRKEVQDLLLEYGVEIVAQTLVEGLSRVKRCTDEGRALMSLDLQVLINGLQHFVSKDVKPNLQIVETFIKAYYLPETEYVHWARSHPEYNKNQVVGLVNLVAAMKGWKRKTRLDILEKIE